MSKPLNHTAVKTLRSKYILALSIIGLFIIGSQILIQYNIAKESDDSRVINIAGRQRMLSQKITKTVLKIQRANNDLILKSQFKELEDALSMWETSHNGLLNGSTTLDLPGQNSDQIKLMFDHISVPYNTIVESATNILELEKHSVLNQDTLNKGIDLILLNEPSFLIGMDKIVFQYDYEAKEKVRTISKIEWTIMTLAILTLLVEARFIFLPAEEYIQKTLNDLVDSEANMIQLNKELKAAQNQIVQQAKMTSIIHLAAGIAHEINNPMGFISSNLATLKKYINRYKDLVPLCNESYESDSSNQALQNIVTYIDDKSLKMIEEDLADLFQETEEGINRVSNIVNGLRSFSQIDKVAELSPYNLNVGIRNTLEISHSQLKRHAKIELELGDLPEIMTQGGEINLLILNLLKNACDAIELKLENKIGLILIKTWSDENQVYMSIKDNGIGIPEENLLTIFNPFFTTKTVGEGIGLGLSISYDIINKLNGKIEATSQLGEWSEFLVVLPIRVKKQENPLTDSIDES